MLMLIAACVNSLGSTDLEDQANGSSLAFSFMLGFNAVFMAGWLIAALANLGN